MKKILFVTSRNILTSCGEIRLIKNRAEAFYNIYGIPTDFVALQKSDRIASKNKEVINAGGSLTCFPFSFGNPLLFLRSLKRLEKEVIARVESGEYCMVVLSGFCMNRLAKIIKLHSNVYTVIDIHGASEDSLLLAKYAPFHKRILLMLSYYIGKLIPDKSLKNANGCFVVTKALEDYVRNSKVVHKNFDFYRIPCATSMNKLSEEEYEAYRNGYRLKYDIKPDEKVFIYSGGVSPWQCIDETIELYRNLSKRIQGKSRLIMLSYNINVIKEKLIDGDNIICDSYHPNELTKVLCAGDYAFFLRKNCITNNVAFPNKYLEYLLAGMYIISTPYVFESAEQIGKNKLGYLYDFDNVDGLVNYIENTPIERKYDVSLIENILYRNSFEYTLKPLIQNIGAYEKENLLDS